MAAVPLHAGTAPDAFDVLHRGQVVSFPAGRLAVDPLMRATIEASDAGVAWDDGTPDAEPEAPRRRGRPAA